MKINPKPLPTAFYTRNDVAKISQDLLGKYLYTHIDQQWTGGIITETEAYNGRTDKACHAYPNKRTTRTETIYQQGGIAYIYLCYGIHSLFNVVTNQADLADAVLIRAIEPTTGLETIQKRRNSQKLTPNLTTGPGRLTKALAITCQQDKESLSGPLFWITDHCIETHTKSIEYTELTRTASPRIGIDYAEEDALLPWRFTINNSKWISK